ncbi:hypothetical protein ABIF38_000226 [Bradyrhizobium japonicum]|nr:hypothetical protein [Bradyrhizobium elkanii]MCP1737710.1 hypothetical protein [Bradyrhizobium elkanii]MCS3575869.1 hypothetical protein [Bradyrhizobium elkanii]MCS3594793.1 hypothetical protein [Bradyrhizobium elkanii]MCS3625987.1 hypothetical protein [Bradyrhizobium elkanii]
MQSWGYFGVLPRQCHLAADLRTCPMDAVTRRGYSTINVGSAVDRILDHPMEGRVAGPPPGCVAVQLLHPVGRGSVHGTTAAPAARSIIPDGISRRRSVSDPSSVQQRTSPSALSITAWTKTSRLALRARPVQNLTVNGPVGVLKPCCTTIVAFIRHPAIARRWRRTDAGRERCGHDGQRRRVDHHVHSNSSRQSLWQRDRKGTGAVSFQLTNRFKRSRSAGPFQSPDSIHPGEIRELPRQFRLSNLIL